MAAQPTFGFSAYLKLICLNSKPQRTEVKKRLSPRDGGAYDYHKRMRALAGDYLLGKADAAETMNLVSRIVKDSERSSAQSGLEKLIKWAKKHQGPYMDVSPAVFRSPGGVFNVRFSPDFGVRIGRKTVAVHIWNTMKPMLDLRFCCGALGLFPKEYAGHGNAPDDFAVLSLVDGNLYRLSEARDVADGLLVVKAIENIFYGVARDLGLSISPPQPGHHAPPPPAP